MIIQRKVSNNIGYSLVNYNLQIIISMIIG